MSIKKQPKLTLVGAGPGDPELISVKGLKALQQADVILYDALVSPELLDHAPDAIKVFVGKRAGNHSKEQDEINQLIVDYALKHGHVVRLKGGDPFIFGRGHEEIEYAEQFDIETHLIPGISSALAVPALCNIPLTRRNISESFWVVAGVCKKGTLSNDVRLAAQSTATVVILMGLNKLNEIVQLFVKEGKANTPTAVIQNGSLPGEKIVSGTVETIEAEVKKHHIGAPAIIVIGEVVSLADFYRLNIENIISQPNSVIATPIAKPHALHRGKKSSFTIQSNRGLLRHNSTRSANAVVPRNDDKI